MAKSNEALFWSLFSAGGVMAALFLPAIILATGFLLPTGDAIAAAERYEQLHDLVANPITKVILLVVIFLSFFHCAHRIQHTAKDIGLRPIAGLLAWACYLGATAGSVIAAVLLWRV
jgi:fumarate reductase subunit D